MNALTTTGDATVGGDLSANTMSSTTLTTSGDVNVGGDLTIPDQYYVANQLGTDLVSTEQGANFGGSVSLNAQGNIMAIGSRLEDLGGSTYPDAGTVRIFRFENSTWNVIGSLDERSSNGSNYKFGRSVKLNGDGTRVAVMAERSDLMGETRIYQYNSDNNWSQIGNTINQPSNEKYKGIALSFNFSGDILALGSQFEQNGNYGSVRIYRYNNTTWDEIGFLEKNNGTEFTRFSQEIDMNREGTKIIIGEPNDSDSSGNIYIYEYISDNNWNETHNFQGTTNTSNAGGSVSMSLDGNVIAFSDEDSNGLDLVRVFKYNGQDWNDIGRIEVGNNIFFKKGISLNQDGTVLGIAGSDTDDSIVIYKYNNNKWHLMTSLHIGESTLSLSSNGLILAVGSYWVNSNAGRVKVYNFQEKQESLNERLRQLERYLSIALANSNYSQDNYLGSRFTTGKFI